MPRRTLSLSTLPLLVLVVGGLLGARATTAIPDASPSPQEPEAAYSIELVAGNVYRFTSGHYRSVFMVTQEGIFVTDPIDDASAKFLRNQLAERFDVPVRFVAYSHNHIDHVYGGRVFDAPGVDFIAHELAREDLVWTKADTRIPNLTFDDRLTVHLGDSSVTLRYHGTNNGRGSVSMHFAPANVMFVVDWIVLGRMPYRDLQGYDIHGMIRSTREILALDWETLVGGHAAKGDRNAVQRYLSYLEALYGAVRDGMLAGKTLDELRSEIRLEEFSDLRQYEDWLPLNVEGVHRILTDQSYFHLRTRGRSHR